MAEESCCTCARLLSTILPEYDEKTEKPVATDRCLDCCNRIICGGCILVSRRFLSKYLVFQLATANMWDRRTAGLPLIVRILCISILPQLMLRPGPFCQISSDPTPLPQGLQDPPAYSLRSSPHPAYTSLTPLPGAEELPAYSSLDIPHTIIQKTGPDEGAAEDVLHFVNPMHDTISSLALRYTVPSHALRKKNNLYADHLLAARKAILIPGEYYKGGVSLSPQPIDGEEEEIRKAKIRRWMITCKVSE